MTKFNKCICILSYGSDMERSDLHDLVMVWLMCIIKWYLWSLLLSAFLSSIYGGSFTPCYCMWGAVEEINDERLPLHPTD